MEKLKVIPTKKPEIILAEKINEIVDTINKLEMRYYFFLNKEKEVQDGH